MHLQNKVKYFEPQCSHLSKTIKRVKLLSYKNSKFLSKQLAEKPKIYQRKANSVLMSRVKQCSSLVDHIINFRALHPAETSKDSSSSHLRFANGNSRQGLSKLRNIYTSSCSTHLNDSVQNISDELSKQSNLSLRQDILNAYCKEEINKLKPKVNCMNKDKDLNTNEKQSSFIKKNYISIDSFLFNNFEC